MRIYYKKLMNNLLLPTPGKAREEPLCYSLSPSRERVSACPVLDTGVRGLGD